MKNKYIERDKHELIKSIINHNEKIKQLESENEELAVAYDNAQKEIATLKNKIKQQKQALEFYADRENYKFHEVEGKPNLPIGNDNGRKARKELIEGVK